jgi:hypothetical protein
MGIHVIPSDGAAQEEGEPRRPQAKAKKKKKSAEPRAAPLLLKH